MIRGYLSDVYTTQEGHEVVIIKTDPSKQICCGIRVDVREKLFKEHPEGLTFDLMMKHAKEYNFNELK